MRSCVDCKYNYNLRWILALLPIQKTYDWFYKRIKSSLPVDDLIQFLRQVHLTDSLSDPSIVPQTYTKAHWRMSVVSSASALLECSRTCSACSTGTLGLPEPSELQRDRKKSINIFKNPKTNKTFFPVLKQVQGPPRRYQGHLAQAYLQISSAPGPKFQLSTGFDSLGGTESWPQWLPIRRENREKTATKVTKIQPSGEQTPTAYLQQFSPTLTWRHANEGSRVLSWPISNNFFFNCI